ncbi:MAG: TM0106 family RecB-like putative nuclease [Actinomycetia bacterium]|nr:TM0106 family RecB-like putative nuclease [Actinomycetes bacterium]
MHRAVDGTLWITASDVVDFLACRRRTRLELDRLAGEAERPPTDPQAELVAREALAHERAVLDGFARDGRRIARIETEDEEAAAAATQAALAAGADVVYQGLLRDPPWFGRPDLLVRTAGISRFGAWRYEVWDAKLARAARGSAVAQAAFYSLLLETTQGVRPERFYLALGTGTVAAYRVGDFGAYADWARRRLLGTLEAVRHGPMPEPDPVAACATCRWLLRCEADRRASDHLALVADIRRDQIRRLRAAGIATVAQLAAASPSRMTGVEAAALGRLVAQARLQVAARAGKGPLYELLPSEAGRGLAALPAPSPGDVFFDLEGDPFAEGGGLEYLWGWVEADSGEYHGRWAHDAGAEREAFAAFVDRVMARLDRWPDLHVYHYAAYEASALLRLAGRHATREAEVDRLLRGGVLVDLYRIVRQALRASTESYSIKALEAFYRTGGRTGPVKDAGASVVAYRAWKAAGDGALLEAIRAYNADDCRSTAELRDWLERLRAAAGLGPDDRPARRDDRPSPGVAARDRAEGEWTAALDRSGRDDPAVVTLAGLVGYHRREGRAAWQAHYRRLAASEEELFEDPEALADLRPDGEEDGAWRFRFDPAQETKRRAGDRVWDPETGRMAGVIRRIDPAAGVVVLEPARDAPRPRHLILAPPVDDTNVAAAVGRVAASVAAAGWDGTPYRAAVALLRCQAPREALAALDPGGDPVAAAIQCAQVLDGACLAVQGPPGTGKTYLGGAVVAALLRAGRTVGVTAQSHKVIGQLLEAVWRAWGPGEPPPAVQKAPEAQAARLPGLTVVDDYARVVRAFTRGAQLVAGTVWLFARPEWDQQLDVVVIDEAGQYALADAVAAATAARNLVLLGDPQQLPQVVEGHHPPGAVLSALGHWLGAHATMPPGHGLFLSVTRRLHPAIAAFVADIAYEGRLASLPACGRQRIVGPAPWGGAGLRWMPVAHEGRTTSSPEEADAVAGAVDQLLRCRWVGPDGVERPLTLDDILVVAAFNAQVGRLEARLPRGARVGTVDRFQGQEGAVVVYSLAASDPERLPRGLEFLYSLNRLNVAVSRARALAVLVCSPALLEATPADPERMRLVNALCGLVQRAEPVPWHPAR